MEVKQGVFLGRSLLMLGLFLFLLNLNSGCMLPDAVSPVGGESEHPDGPHHQFWAV